MVEKSNSRPCIISLEMGDGGFVLRVGGEGRLFPEFQSGITPIVFVFIHIFQS